MKVLILTGNFFYHCCATIAILAFAVSPLSVFLRTVEQMPAETHGTAAKNDEKAAQIKENEYETPNELETGKQEVKVAEEAISNQPQTIKAALKEAFTSVTFLLITLGFSVCGFHVSFIATHLPAYLQGHGVDSSLAGRCHNETRHL